MQDDSGSKALVFLYLFLVITGAYSIIVSLLQLRNQKDNPSPGSAIETKWFKFKAPAGFVYGVFAILAVIGIVKYTSLSEYRLDIVRMKAEILRLQKENEYLKAVPGFSGESVSVFRVTFKAKELLSIFGGRVVVYCERNVFSPSRFIFNGITGISRTKEGPYTGNTINYDMGDKFFIKLENSELWGVNVINVHGDVEIELYRI